MSVTLVPTHTLATTASQSTKGRLDYIDVARGVLIILVVLGHSSFLYSKYLYWFHMPAFFIISGMLHKQAEDVRGLIGKRVLSFLIPYVAYGIAIGVFVAFSPTTGAWVVSDFTTTLQGLVRGGDVLKGNLGVFWFINCLLLTIISFTLTRKWIKSNSVLMVVGVIAYATGFILNRYLDNSLPWAFNVVPYAYAYFALGFFVKGLAMKLNNISSLIAVSVYLVCAVLIASGVYNFINFEIDLKYGVISDPLLGLCIPIVLTLAVLVIANFIKNSQLKQVLAYVGQNTLPIMYLHIVVNNILSIILLKLIGEPISVFAFILAGLAVPLFLTVLFKRHYLTRVLFLGESVKTALSSGSVAVVAKSHSNH